MRTRLDLKEGIDVTQLSAFSNLDAPAEPVFAQAVARAKLLPACCGTYAFYDAAGDLLYIGKAKNVRTRVQCHLRDKCSERFLLRPWSHLIARIEARFAHSEMEALLVEADLVARLQPTFNRQMRSWSRYCYLVVTGNQVMPLSVSSQLQSWRPCFGPYRSRRQAAAIVEAIFRLLARNGEADLLARCYGVLSGEGDSLVGELQRQCERPPRGDGDGVWARWLPELTEALRGAAERAALLRRAEDVLGGIIFMHGSDERETVAVIGENGLHLERIEACAGNAETFLQGYRAAGRTRAGGSARRLPKAISDCLCLAAHQIRRFPNKYRLLRAEKAMALSSGDLLALAFGEMKVEA